MSNMIIALLTIIFGQAPAHKPNHLSENIKDQMKDLVDLDGDGFAGSLDCDDHDSGINPDAVDIAFDGIDQNCDGINACEFEVEQTDRSVVLMPNELRMSLDVASPSGAKVPSYQETLRFNLEVVHPECPDVTWENGTFEVLASDNAGTQYIVDTDASLYNLTVNGLAQTIWDGLVEIGPAHMDANVTGDLIPAGETYTYSVWLDLSGASAATDDSVRVDALGGTMIWCSMGACSDIDSNVVGGSIVF